MINIDQEKYKALLPQNQLIYCQEFCKEIVSKLDPKTKSHIDNGGFLYNFSLEDEDQLSIDLLGKFMDNLNLDVAIQLIKEYIGLNRIFLFGLSENTNWSVMGRAADKHKKENPNDYNYKSKQLITSIISNNQNFECKLIVDEIARHFDGDLNYTKGIIISSKIIDPIEIDRRRAEDPDAKDNDTYSDYNVYPIVNDKIQWDYKNYNDWNFSDEFKNEIQKTVSENLLSL